MNSNLTATASRRSKRLQRYALVLFRNPGCDGTCVRAAPLALRRAAKPREIAPRRAAYGLPVHVRANSALDGSIDCGIEYRRSA